GPHDLLELLEESLLVLHLLDDGFDDEIAVAELVEIVLGVADLHEPRVVLVEERGRTRFQRLFEPPGRERVSIRRSSARPRRRRDDVEKENLETGVGEVGGDATAHAPGPDDGRATDRLFHWTRDLSSEPRPPQASSVGSRRPTARAGRRAEPRATP